MTIPEISVQNRKVLCEGEVTVEFTGYEGGGWVEQWTGPGGRLIIVSLAADTPAAALGIDALETLYRPDGTTSQWALAEGDNYYGLPELMGSHWVGYEAGIS